MNSFIISFWNYFLLRFLSLFFFDPSNCLSKLQFTKEKLLWSFCALYGCAFEEKIRSWLYGWWLHARTNGCYAWHRQRLLQVEGGSSRSSFFAATLCLVPSIRLRGDVRNMMAIIIKKELSPCWIYVLLTEVQNQGMVAHYALSCMSCLLFYINYVPFSVVIKSGKM